MKAFTIILYVGLLAGFSTALQCYRGCTTGDTGEITDVSTCTLSDNDGSGNACVLCSRTVTRVDGVIVYDFRRCQAAGQGPSCYTIGGGDDGSQQSCCNDKDGCNSASSLAPQLLTALAAALLACRYFF